MVYCHHALVVYSVSPAYLRVFQCCGILSPEVRWFGSFPWSWAALRAAVRCEMNGFFYTSMVLRRNECGCLHVHGAAVLGTDLFSGTRSLLLKVQYWEDSEWPVCFTRCCAVFVVSPLCFQKAQSFCNYFLHVCSKEFCIQFAFQSFEFPLVDRQCLVLDRQCRKKKAMCWDVKWMFGIEGWNEGFGLLRISLGMEFPWTECLGIPLE